MTSSWLMRMSFAVMASGYTSWSASYVGCESNWCVSAYDGSDATIRLDLTNPGLEIHASIHNIGSGNSLVSILAPYHHLNQCLFVVHYNDIIMDPIASQITSLTIVYSIVYSDADHQSSASLAFVRGIHKWPVTRKMFPFDDVIISGAQRTSVKLN